MIEKQRSKNFSQLIFHILEMLSAWLNIKSLQR